MSRSYPLVVAVVACLFVQNFVEADQIELTGTVRDFRADHPDFENTYNGSFPLITGMVKPVLGEAGLPVLNISEVNCTSVMIASLQDISNVVLLLDDGTEYKYDSLELLGVETTGTWAVPAEHTGKNIVGAWVKSGSNTSGDGPGYGEWFAGEHTVASAVTETHDVVNESETITVTFVCEAVIDAQWRVASEASFNQWFRNTTGVNQSLPLTIVLDNGRQYPGGIYRYQRSKHNGQSFFPLDNKTYGNEGRSHNYHFTYELDTNFIYTNPDFRDNDLVFNFSGDDDVWVYINGKLVVDLGGVHGEQYGSVNVDSMAASLGLEPGKTYSLRFFFAERHTVESNFTIETTIQFLPPLYD